MSRRNGFPNADRLALAVAIALHGAALLLLRHSVHRITDGAELTAPSARARLDEPLEIEVSEPMSRAEPQSGSPATLEPSRRSDQVQSSTASAPGQAMARAPAPPSLEVPEPRAGDDPNIRAELATSEDVSRSARETPIDLGLGRDGFMRWLRTPEAEAAAREQRPRRRARGFAFEAPPASTTGGVQEGLEERDRKLGLSPSGRVISAFHRAAHDSSAPQLGIATFQVTVLRSGSVEVSLDTSSDQTDKWRAVGIRAAAELRRALPRLPKARKGLRLRIEVTAEEILPNGARVSELHPARLEVTPPRVRSSESARAELRDDNPVSASSAPPPAAIPLKVELPGVFLARRGKVCDYQLGLTPLGPVFRGGCDLSNAGAKPLRRVQAQISDETLF